jgi:hypothetical protein
METFYSSGIRRMEQANLKLQDLEMGTLLIHQDLYPGIRQEAQKGACNHGSGQAELGG